MLLRLTSILVVVGALVGANIAHAADGAIETPAACKVRLKSEFKCLKLSIEYSLMFCELRSISGSGAACSSEYKAYVKPHYDAMLQASSKKPAAVTATKKVMQSFIALIDDSSRSKALQDDLKRSFAALELELM